MAPAAFHLALIMIMVIALFDALEPGFSSDSSTVVFGYCQDLPFEVPETMTKILHMPISPLVTETGALAGLIPTTVFLMVLTIMATRVAWSAAATRLMNTVIMRLAVRYSDHILRNGLLNRARTHGSVRASGFLLDRLRNPKRPLARSRAVSLAQIARSTLLTWYMLVSTLAGTTAAAPLSSSVENLGYATSLTSRLADERPIDTISVLIPGAKALIAACVVTPVVCLLALVYRVFGRDAVLAFCRERLRPQTTTDEVLEDGHEMIDIDTVNAVNGGTSRADTPYAEVTGPRCVLIRRFLRRFPSPVSRMAGTKGSEDEILSTLPIRYSPEEREEAVVEIGSIFEDETLSRPDDLDIQDL